MGKIKLLLIFLLLLIVLCGSVSLYYILSKINIKAIRQITSETFYTAAALSKETLTPKPKRVVFWTSWFGDHDWNHVMNGETEILLKCPKQCTFHIERADPLKYDALLFHARDPQSPPEQRTHNQIYIIIANESPSYRGNYFIKGGNFYNWSASYSRKSDIVLPNLILEKKIWPNPSDRFLPKLPQMSINWEPNDAMIVWVVSHCRTHSKHEDYIDQLRNYLGVDVYGKCGMPCYKNLRQEGLACYETLAQTGKYKFYLAFENSACLDYITEKAVRALKVGLVPIVYGGLNSTEYTKKLPPNSFIDVRNFSSPEKLAKYLSYLNTTAEAYMGYQSWRLDYQIAHHKLPSRHNMCKVCQALHNTSMTHTHRSVNWGDLWDPNKDCDATLIDKVKGPRKQKS